MASYLNRKVYILATIKIVIILTSQRMLSTSSNLFLLKNDMEEIEPIIGNKRHP